MYNIDDTVFVKGTIVGVKKEDNGIMYTVAFQDPLWNRPEEIRVVASDVKKIGFFTMEELEEACKEN